MYVTGRFFTVIQTAATRPPNIFCNKCYTNYALQSLWTILKVVWNPDMTVCLLYNPSGQQYVTSAILRTYPYMSSLVMYKLDLVISHPPPPPTRLAHPCSAPQAFTYSSTNSTWQGTCVSYWNIQQTCHMRHIHYIYTTLYYTLYGRIVHE